jgi:ABC-2 type transport system permease protein
MNAVLVLLRKDFALLLKDRVSIVITFVVPFALIYLFGQIYRVNSSDSGPSGIPVAVVNQSDNPAAARLVEALKSEKSFKVLTQFVNGDGIRRPMTEEDLRGLMKKDVFRFALVIPHDVIRPDGFGIHLKTYSNPRNEVEAQTVQGILQKVIFSSVPELLGQSFQARAKAYLGDEKLDRFNTEMASAVSDAFGGDPDRIKVRISEGGIGLRQIGVPVAAPDSASDTKAEAGFLSKVVNLENVQVAGGNVKSPMATLLVGGWAMQFLLFALTASATALFRERDLGIFQRILAAPATRGSILWSKFLYGVCLGLIQLSVLFAAGHVLYGIDVAGHLGLLLLVCVFAAAACTSFGMLIASVSPTPESARGISTFVILLMCAIGGAWFPVSFMPEFIQKFSKLTLVYWSMEGFSQVLWSNDSLSELLPTLGILALITAVVMGFSVWRFRRGRIFG